MQKLLDHLNKAIYDYDLQINASNINNIIFRSQRMCRLRGHGFRVNGSDKRVKDCITRLANSFSRNSLMKKFYSVHPKVNKRNNRKCSVCLHMEMNSVMIK